MKYVKKVTLMLYSLIVAFITVQDVDAACKPTEIDANGVCFPKTVTASHSADAYGLKKGSVSTANDAFGQTTKKYYSTTDESGYVYCLDHNMNPPSGTFTYQYLLNDKTYKNGSCYAKGISYIINNAFPKVNINADWGTNSKYWVTQAAIWYYADKYCGETSYKTTNSGNQFRTLSQNTWGNSTYVQKVRSLASNANTYGPSVSTGFGGSSNVSVTLSVAGNDYELTSGNDGYYYSKLITATVSGGSSITTSLTSSFGAEMVKSDKKTKFTQFSTGTTQFYVRFAANRITNTNYNSKINLSITVANPSGGGVKVAVYRNLNNSSQQPIVLAKEYKTATSSSTASKQFKLKVQQCDFNNPDHFKDNNGDGNPDYIDTLTGKNCCEYYNTRTDLVEEYPICGSCSDDDLNPKSTSAICEEGKDTATYTDGITDINNNTCLAYVDDNSSVEIAGSSSYEKLEINDYCSIVCIESISMDLPTEPNPVFGIGHFVWPTSSDSAVVFGNNNKLTVTGTKTCKVLIKSKTLSKDVPAGSDRNKKLAECALKADSRIKGVKVGDLYNLEPNMIVSYSGEYDGVNAGDVYENGSTGLTAYNVNYSCNGSSCGENNLILNEFDTGIISTSDYSNYVSGIRNIRLTITKTMNYKLPRTYNNYISKLNGVATDSCSGDNCIYVGYGNIPLRQLTNSLALRSDYSGSVSLTYSNLGHNGRFDSVANNAEYTCDIGDMHENDTCDNCCPILSDFPNKKLTDEICNSYKSWAECEAKECYSDNNVCPAGTEMAGMDISSEVEEYVSKGLSVEEAIDRIVDDGVCDDPGDERYFCHINSNMPNKNITNCVNEYRGTGMTEHEALLKCYDEECSSSSGRRVIYRVIDLDNPFPSISGSGRTPGSNWNVNDNVNKYITNNRGVTTKAVYNKTPMYSFILDAETIRTIRSYNKTMNANGKNYDDFNLTCDSNGRACISSVIRDNSFGLVGGTCQDRSVSNFYKCQYEG